ncbi:choline dehydrogenase-like flavoprotein [Arthrobacter sp. SORGH_AS 212]|uniref:GMC oxidoreductase n=1 Tax=Pseudarthrobacter sp. SORGH_AS 212 TaxID=3041777 RepID=UPI0027800B3A|nr:choline dehydrogenase-like flavoprotein [Arthrobacter sp. SORGH_AS_0212]
MITTAVPSARPYPAVVDVAIIGSGPAGAAYARILSELSPQASIAIFEAGPTISDPPGSHVKNIASVQDREVAQRRSEGKVSAVPSGGNLAEYARDVARPVRPGTFLLDDGWQQPGETGLPGLAFSSNVGGMAAHWTGACPRPGGSERIAFLPNMDELLSEAERLLSVSSEALAGAPLADLVRSRLSAALDDGRAPDRRVQPMPLAVRRTDDGRFIWSGADVVFGDETRNNPRARLFDESVVVRVLTDGDEVSGVRVRDDKSGDEHEIAARYVVVAADALRGPQLLFASGIRPEALGRYLNDQPQIVHAVRLTGVVDDVPAASSSDTTITAQSGVSWVPFTDEQPFHGQVMQLDASPVPISGDVIPGSIVGLGWFCAKDLQASDRVVFSENTTDAYGLPAMNIHYTFTERDEQTLSAARQSVVAAARSLGEPLGDQPLTFPAGASLHYQGTLRMGTSNDGTAVCDPAGQVWDVRGLFVAGNGVIPTPTACNPTLTGVALAVAGARQIAESINSTSTEK